ncbi:MAG TPA: hypothetical protein VJT49_13610 [Amycolatopsis sp.]|nr:hypothetical protein [Amycolatopsis sp.]HKS46122.1 hypothetical protein [Amycolatopsis sp.]
MDQFVVDFGGDTARMGDEVVVFGPGTEREPTVSEWARTVPPENRGWSENAPPLCSRRCREAGGAVTCLNRRSVSLSCSAGAAVNTKCHAARRPAS